MRLSKNAKTRVPFLFSKQCKGQRSLARYLYTHLVDFGSTEYPVALAQTLEEEDEPLKTGFEFVRYSAEDKVAIYRKRK